MRQTLGELDYIAMTLAPAEGDGSSGGLPQLEIDLFASQIFWLLLTFAFLYMMMARVALPRIAGVLEDRRDKIADDLDKAEELNAQAQAAIEAYEKALAEARSRAHAIAQDTRDQIKAEAEAQRAETETRLNRKLEEAEARITETKERALSNVREVASETAAAIVNRVIGDNLEPAETLGEVDKALNHAEKPQPQKLAG